MVPMALTFDTYRELLPDAVDLGEISSALRLIFANDAYHLVLTGDIPTTGGITRLFSERPQPDPVTADNEHLLYTNTPDAQALIAASRSWMDRAESEMANFGKEWGLGTTYYVVSSLLARGWDPDRSLPPELWIYNVAGDLALHAARSASED